MKPIRWQTLDHADTETLQANTGPEGLEFHGTGSHYGLVYTIRCDDAWQVRQCHVQLGPRQVQLRRDEQGIWLDGQSQVLPLFTGCTDVDISATPFTNTLPIRRLKLAGQPGPHLIEILYIKVPELSLQRQQQRYTWQQRVGEVDSILYENMTSRYSAELRIATDGYVLDYPGRFRRT